MSACWLALLAAQPAHRERRPPRRRHRPAVAELSRGYAAYRAGDYHEAATRAARRGRQGSAQRGLGAVPPRRERVLRRRLHGRARGVRAARAREAAGRAQMAPFRIADCLWMEGDRGRPPAKAYARLVKTATARTGDAALARFRIAELTAARDRGRRPEAVPGHRPRLPGPPAGRRGAAPDRRAAPTPQTTAPPPPAPLTAPPAPPAGDLAPPDRLRRAESLTKDRHWDEALAELAEAAGGAAARARRRARLPDRDDEVPHAARLRRRRASCCWRGAAPVGRQGGVGAVPRRAGAVARRSRRRGDRRLPQGDRAVPALALGGRGAVPVRAGSTTTAGRFKESLPALQATLDHFGKSAFADDAAWCLAFAHFLLGDTAEAVAGLERYARMPATGIAADERAARVAYWRARLRDKVGTAADEARGGATATLARRAPLSFYGLLARARLEAGRARRSRLALPVKKVAVRRRRASRCARPDGGARRAS